MAETSVLPRLIRVYADTVRHSVCRGTTCRAAITFAKNVKSGATMVITGDIDPVGTEREQPSGRRIFLVDAASVHHITCPDVAKFKGAVRGGRR